jgi:hypothetical protein
MYVGTNVHTRIHNTYRERAEADEADHVAKQRIADAAEAKQKVQIPMYICTNILTYIYIQRASRGG